MTARTLWGTGKGLDRRLFDYTAGEDRAVGRATPPLGRARQPRPHRGAAGGGPPRRARARATATGAPPCTGGGGRRPPGVARGPGGRAHGGGVLAHAAVTRRGRAAPHRPLAQRPGRVRPPALPEGRLLALHALRARRRGGAARLRPAASARALARLHARAPGHALVGRTLGRCAMPRECSTPSSRIAGALGPGGSLAAGQRRRLWRAAAAQARGRRQGARLLGPRPQRGRGAGGAGQARGRGAVLVHPAGTRRSPGSPRTSSCSAARSSAT